MTPLRLSALIASLFFLALPAQAELLDVPKTKSGVWEGYCSTYGRCSAGINTAYKSYRVGALKFSPTFVVIYESKGDRFLLDFTMFYTPPGFKFDLKNSHIVLPNGKLRFKQQKHHDAGRGRMTSKAFVPIRRKDRRIKDIMSYLAKANSLRVNLAYTYKGKRYSGPVDFSLKGSAKVITTVYAQFDQKGRTFEAGKKNGATRPGKVTWERRSCNSGMFNWCVFTDNPEGTAALVGLGLLTLKTLGPIAASLPPADMSYGDVANTGTNSAKSGSASSQRQSTGGPRFRTVATYRYGPGQTTVAKIKCTGHMTSMSVKYYPDNNPPYYVGTAGGRTLEEAANKACGG